MSSSSKFDKMIAEAAAYVDHGIADPGADGAPFGNGLSEAFAGASTPNYAKAQAEAEAAFATAAAKISNEYGFAVIWKKPRLGRRRTKAEYAFWKTPVTMFIEFPQTLDLGPTALARRFGPSEANFTITKDTFRAPLSGPARREARRLLQSRGYNLALTADFSIRDVQKAMRDERDRAAGVVHFKTNVEIVGNTVYCNGKGFKMQPTGSGKMRIRAGNGWLPVDALTAFLSGKA